MPLISERPELSQNQNTLRRNAITRNGSKALASGGLSCIFGIAALDKFIEIIDMSSKNTPDALLATGGDAAALIGYGLGTCAAGLLAAYYGHRTTDHLHARFRYSDDRRADQNSPAPPER
ncbi:MAG: hypothetical protein KDJ75_01855 [Alphaproteobacteria bacterium]|nr:hypothetical protein [Alphaproteobacteria bacterium]